MDITRDKWLVLIGCLFSTFLFLLTTTGEVWIVHKPPKTHQNKNGSWSSDNKIDNTIDYYGIWRFCFRNGKCMEIVEGWRYTKWFRASQKTHNWLQAVRIFACTASTVVGFGLMNAIVTIMKKTKTLKESKYMSVAGPCIMIIALSIFTGYEWPEHDKYTWGWTFLLGWASAFFSLFYGVFILYMISKRKRKIRLRRGEEEEMAVEDDHHLMMETER